MQEGREGWPARVICHALKGISRMNLDVVRRSKAVRVLLWCLVAAAFAATPVAQQTFNLQDPIPFDAAVHRGALPNGLQYFVRHNDRPAKRLSLRLVVKAGS